MKTIPLVNKGGVTLAETIVDDADFAWLSRWTWHLGAKGYAVRFDTALNRNVWMAREIVGLKLGDRRQADHISRDKLDNRRANLRVVTAAQNSQNVPARRKTSAHRGVCWDRSIGRWIAYAHRHGKRVYLGSFADESAAAAKAVAWRREHMPYSIEGAAA